MTERQRVPTVLDELRAMARRATEGYEIEGPLPIKLEVALRTGLHGVPSFVIHAWMSTIDRDSRRPATIERQQEIDFPSRAGVAFEHLETLLHQEVQRLVREVWAHELAEWFKYKGERVWDPHEDE